MYLLRDTAFPQSPEAAWLRRPGMLWRWVPEGRNPHYPSCLGTHTCCVGDVILEDCSPTEPQNTHSEEQSYRQKLDLDPHGSVQSSPSTAIRTRVRSLLSPLPNLVSRDHSPGVQGI